MSWTARKRNREDVIRIKRHRQWGIYIYLYAEKERKTDRQTER